MSSPPDEPTPAGPGSRTGRLAPWLAVGLLAALAAVVLVANRHQPIVGNALVYARMTYDLLDQGPRACSQSELNKACGYAFVSAPFVAWLGANRGLKVSSALLTLLALAACLLFFRSLNRTLGIPPGLLGLELLVLALNPLVLYQLLAAYVDAPFLGAAVLSFVALERLLGRERPTVLDAVWYLLALVLALWLKHQAVSLPVLHLAWALARPGRLGRLWREHRRVVGLTVGALLLFGGLIALARAGWLPLFNLRADKTPRPVTLSASIGFLALTQLGFFLAITVHGLLLLPLVRSARAMLGPLLVVLAYLLAVAFNPGARNNPRWFLPLLPFLALLVAQAAARLPRRGVVVVALAFVAVNVPLTLAYNLEGAYDWLAARGLRLPRHPNLGVTSEMRSHRMAIEQVNRDPGRLPVYVHQRYYYGGARGVFPRGGFFAPHVDVRELDEERDIQHRRFYVMSLMGAMGRAEVTRLLLCDGPVPTGGYWCMAHPAAAGERLIPYRFWKYDVPRRLGEPEFERPPPAGPRPKPWQTSR